MAYGDLPLDAPCKANKGLEGGACNRQSCQAEPALNYNHGSHRWYCGDCAIAIGEDRINLRDWNLRHRPECGHAMFETRDEIEARKAKATPVSKEYSSVEDVRNYLPVFPPRKNKSSSLERLLRGKPKGRI